MTVTEFEVMTLLPLVYCAKTVVWPAEVEDSTHIGSSPLSTDIRDVFAVCHVTLAETSMLCPPALAIAVKQVVAVELTGSVAELGVTVTLVTFPKVTVAVAVALAVPEDAVIVLVPAEMPLSRPPVLIVATVGVSLDQQTVVPVQLVPAVRVKAFPLLSVPAAFSCSVSPILTVGAEGSMAMLETVGLTKNPVQLAARASTKSTAKAPARRSFPWFDRIAMHAPKMGLPAGSQPLRYDLCATSDVKNCSREA